MELNCNRGNMGCDAIVESRVEDKSVSVVYGKHNFLFFFFILFFFFLIFFFVKRNQRTKCADNLDQ